MFLYEPFFQRFGVRRGEQLQRPPLAKLEMLELPRNSLLHYVSSSPLEIGPPANEYLFRNITRPIMMSHVTELFEPEGSPRNAVLATAAVISSYHRNNRQFRLFNSLEQVNKDEQALLVYSYGILSQRYKYARTVFAEYYQWHNVQNTLWHKVKEIAAVTHRHQFVMCKLPQTLPSLSDLAIGEKGLSQRLVTIFDNPDSLFMLEMWKWLGAERKSSVIAQLPLEALSRVNLVFQETGKWFVVNLGKLNSWRRPTNDEMLVSPELQERGIKPDVLRKLFLRMMMTLFEVRTAALQAEAKVLKDEVNSLKKKSTMRSGAGAKIPINLPSAGQAAADIVVDTKNRITGSNAQVDPELDNQPGKPDSTISEVEKLDVEDTHLEADLAQLDAIARKPQLDGEEIVLDASVGRITSPEGGVLRVCDAMADMGILSAAEHRRYTTLASSYKSIPSPDGKGTLADFLVIAPEKLKIEVSPSIPDIATVTDKTMLKSSLHAFDERYIRDVMAKDVASMVMGIQNAGIAVTDYTVETMDDVLGSYEIHTARVNPVEGVASTLRFKLPKISAEGTYEANGTKYRMRKQRGDLPIRKVTPTRVALTSYYGKVMVERSTKRVNDYGTWLRNSVMALGLDANSSVVTDMKPASVFENTFTAPSMFTTMAMGYRSFIMRPSSSFTPEGTSAQVLAPFAFNFDYTKRESLYGADALRQYEVDGRVVCGKSADGRILVIEISGDVHASSPEGWLRLGTFEDLLGLNGLKAPVNFAEITVMGRSIPLGIVLGYEMGLNKLIKRMHVQPRRVPAGTRVGLQPHEYALVFSDETLVFERRDYRAAMILAGFNEYHKEIRGFTSSEFNHRGVYLNILETHGSSARYLREIDLLYQMFIDPIARDLLTEMREPTDFRGLLLRASELLETDYHPDELDSAFMRIKGYERMAGAVYSEIVRSVRLHNSRLGRARQQIDLNPYAVWKNISQDPSNTMVSDINPINNLREMEAVTYSGVGGRNSRSMTKNTREYHRNDMGVISEATVDSSDVAINTYTSADPQFTSLRGIARRYKIGETGATALLSSSALISPGADRDDPKRVNFIGIQHRHGIACSGYSQMPVRTGYEQVVAHRTSDLFALTAKKPGSVVSVSETGMVVKYDDGEVKGIELGRRFGNASGLIIPHEVVTTTKAGQKFKVGDLLSHNPGFFEKDLLNPNQVVWKAGVLVRTVLLESTATLEDSSAISKKVAGQLSSKMTKVKTIVVRFDQSVKKLVKPGTTVNSDDILCIIEDAVTANNDMFDAESLDTLRLLSAQAPQAKVKGLIERVEAFYHGDVEDMSKSLQQLVAQCDRDMGKRFQTFGKQAFTGLVDEGFRVDGDQLAFDTMAIRIYITSDVPAGVGDKGVFGNQMKTVFGVVMPKEMRSESGLVIDAVFGQKSIADRIVLSPELSGTTATLLDVIGKQAASLYFARK